MYSPAKDGIERSARSVTYVEAAPPHPLREMVHCFWQLRTEKPLSEDFVYHVVPDACVNLLFNQLDPTITAVTALETTSKRLNLGKSFDFVGVQLLPGVWRGGSEELVRDLVDQPYQGQLSLIETNRKLIPLPFSDKQAVLAGIVEEWAKRGLLAPDPVILALLKNCRTLHSVADMAAITGKSPRQLQRLLKKATGFSPHDFLKLIRVQDSFKHDSLDRFADQSNFIHSFRKITGYTQARYKTRFHV